MVREDLYGQEKTFGSRPKGSEGGSLVDIFRKMVPSRGNKCAKFLRQERAWHNLRNRREASVAAQNDQSRGVAGDKAGKQWADSPRWPGR